MFLDTSVYQEDVDIVSPTLYVKFPDFEKEYSVAVEPGINILNTSRLAYTQCIAEFPDGVYCLRFEINNGDCSVTERYYRATSAWKRLDEILESNDWTNNKDFLEKFNKIQLYLRGAESVVKSNPQQAQQLYKQATEILNCFTNVRMLKRECNCN